MSSHSAAGIRHRVAVTGIGIASAIGNRIAEYCASVRSCRSGIAWRDAPNERWPEDAEGNPARILAAGVSDVDAEGALGSVLPETIDPHTKLALAASQEAIDRAGADVLQARPDRVAVIIGTAAGGDLSRDHASHRVFGKKIRPHPLTVVRVMANGAVSALTMAHQLTGPAFTVASACASATHAIGQAFRMVQYGMVDVAVTGGAESLPSYSQYQAWRQMKVLSPDGCRPFASNRNGFVFGEGAGILVLERLEHAVARGARIHAEIAGFGSSSDASDWVVPESEGLQHCMASALDDAGIPSSEIAYVNAHATGTERGDLAEGRALAALLGSPASRVPVSSTKALHGHALGAAGAIELIATILGLEEGWTPPMPIAPQDPSVELCLVGNEPQPLSGEFALKNSFGFGGLNASIVVRRAR